MCTTTPDTSAPCPLDRVKGSSMRTDFLLNALKQALSDRQPERDESHSGRGLQGRFNVSIRYTKKLAEPGI